MERRLAVVLLFSALAALVCVNAGSAAAKTSPYTVWVSHVNQKVAGAEVQVWSVNMEDGTVGALVATGVTAKSGKAEFRGLARYTPYYLYVIPPGGARVGPELVFTDSAGGGTWYFYI
jgi:hypothetical protein